MTHMLLTVTVQQVFSGNSVDFGWM